MDNSISNVGVRFEGALLIHKFQRFLETLIGDEETAKDYLRIKGVLHIHGSAKKFVLQAVHELREQNFTKPWGDDKTRESRLIFIGRGMQKRRQMLTEGVMNCLVKPLRFAVGQKVFANTGEEYEAARVMRHWDEFNAYRIKIEADGEELWAPIDEDFYIKV